MIRTEHTLEEVKVFHNRKLVRVVPIHLGGEYRVAPINPKKKKYRGEKVRLIAFHYLDNTVSCVRVDSKWHFSRNVLSKIHVHDLVYEPIPHQTGK